MLNLQLVTFGVTFKNLKKMFFFWLYCTACEIIVSLPGIEPVPSALGAQSLSHWTTRNIFSWLLMIKVFNCVAGTPVKTESIAIAPPVPLQCPSEATLVLSYIPERRFCLVLDFMWVKSYHLYSGVSDFFHSTYFWDSSGLLSVTVAHFSLFMSTIPAYGCIMV